MKSRQMGSLLSFNCWFFVTQIIGGARELVVLFWLSGISGNIKYKQWTKRVGAPHWPENFLNILSSSTKIINCFEDFYHGLMMKGTDGQTWNNFVAVVVVVAVVVNALAVVGGDVIITAIEFFADYRNTE